MKSDGFLRGADIAREPAGENVTRQVMGYDDSVMLVKVDFAEGSMGTRHTHPHAQTSYIASGKFEVTIGGVAETLAAGDGFYVEPDVEHGVLCLEKGAIIDCFAPGREDFVK